LLETLIVAAGTTEDDEEDNEDLGADDVGEPSLGQPTTIAKATDLVIRPGTAAAKRLWVGPMKEANSASTGRPTRLSQHSAGRT